MVHKKNGLNDSDKILITVALWIAALSLFATALTLPMLPDKVAIFYRPAEGAHSDYYSKYNNLLLILTSVIPAAIIIVTAMLKRRNRLQNNFVSIMLFSIMLSLCMAGVIIYGINEQFGAISAVRTIYVHNLVTLGISFVLSLVLALMPMPLHAPQFTDSLATDVGTKWRLMRVCEKFWSVGAYGFLLCACVCVFVPDYFSYIPLAVLFVAYVVFVAVCTAKDSGRVKAKTDVAHTPSANTVSE